MKLKLAFVAAALLLMGVSAAQAQTLDIVLDNPVQTAASDPNGFPDLVFNGQIENNTDSTIFLITGDSLSVPAGAEPDLPHSDLDIGSWPHVLRPGDSFRADWLFGVEFPNGLSGFSGSFTGTYAVTGNLGENGEGDPFTAEVQYTINFEAAAIPEPGSVALLVGGLIGGSLVLQRRRK